MAPRDRHPVPPLTPGPGQESVWDYPRPPRVDPVSEHVGVRFAGVVIADTHDVVRVLETSHPPGYYLPRSSFTDGVLVEVPGGSVCEYKGRARYYDVRAGGQVAARAAWAYPEPWEGYTALGDRVSLYPGAMDLCTVDGEEVLPQEGQFYGGWVTSRVVGPFKGAPGTLGW